jgi:hypothetical protein
MKDRGIPPIRHASFVSPSLRSWNIALSPDMTNTAWFDVLRINRNKP